MRRRNFLRSLAGGALFSALGLKPRRAPARSARFEHGVASGDPESDRVILWTRVSGVGPERVAVSWKIASDPQLSDVVAKGSTWAAASSDFTVKVDATGLPAGRTLYFGFECDGVASPTGRTKTLPTGATRKAQFAVVSCSNYPYGFFHVYRAIAKRDDLDAVVHLGDYLYEYGLGEYATEHAERLGRVPEPREAIVTLEDYRRRHAQYKADPDSKAMHGRHPLIAVWDDHELANDAWQGGAQNHSAEQGDWGKRRDAAIQAWLEWMPVRVRHERARTRTFREFHFGDLAALIMLDTRLFGRDRQPDAGEGVTPESIEAAMRDPQRRMLGAEQENWFKDALKRGSNATWQLIGQQVMVSPTRSPDLEPLLDLESGGSGSSRAYLPPEALAEIVAISKSNPPMLLDTWNGYPVARATFLNDLEQLATNPVVLSGDLHTSLAGNLVPHGGTEPVAVEFMTSSVSSPGFAEYLPETKPGALAAATIELNPTLTYMETARRGWLEIELTHAECTASWHLVDTVHSSEHRFEVDGRFRVRAGALDEGMQPV